MSDASKRLHDAVEDVVTDSVTQMAETNATPEAVPKMNRVRRALAAVNTEAMITTASAPRQHSGMQTMMGVQAASARVPQQTMALAAALDRANPSISLREAQRLYPSIPLDGTAPAPNDKGQGKGKRIVLVEDQSEGSRCIRTRRCQLALCVSYGTYNIQLMMRCRSLKVWSPLNSGP